MADLMRICGKRASPCVTSAEALWRCGLECDNGSVTAMSVETMYVGVIPGYAARKYVIILILLPAILTLVIL